MSRKQRENSFEIKLKAVNLYLEKNIEGRKRNSELTLEEENLRLRAEVEYLKKLIQVERL